MTSYTDETVSNLIINKLTKAQYDAITTPSETELYIVTDEEALPSQTGQSGKYLTTNGTTASWETVTIPTVDQTYDATSANAQSGVAVASAISSAISSTYKAAGSVSFSNLPTLSSSNEGKVYNVINAFTTTSDFVEGAGNSYPAGTNVVCINTSGTTYKWDVLAGFVDLSNYVTKDGDQDITGIKTFIGEKRIIFKQSTATDKLGFILTDSSNVYRELAAFEYRPNTISTNALLSISSQNSDYVGFRYWNGTNIIAPKPTTSTNYYIPIKITNGSSNVTADSTGTVDISPITLPSQTGNSGKYLTTNGTSASWATVDTFPSQTGNSGKYLTTNGTTASWGTITGLPSQTGYSGRLLTTNGTTASWTTLNYVTTDTNQDITGIKTFIGEKRIIFKQSTATDKLGFTLYNSNSSSSSSNEVGAFEYNPSSNALVDSKPILVLNSNGNTLLGFRYWGSRSSNILAGVPTTAGNYFIPVNITNGTTTVTADNTGTVNISSIIPDALPSQSGNSGKFLTTNGSSASWATVTQPSIATTSTAGLVKPDGTSITIDSNGTISASAGAYAMVIVDYTAEEE